jgi:glycosyltransferase involved in cell wall biosynthesis
MKDFGEFCILIPTRNRRREVEILLKSILGSTIMPSQIIISSSGEDIGNTIQRYSDALEITYIHSEVAGQINQKKLGLSLLSRRIKWVVFLDDDLVVMPDTFENAFSQIEKF